MSDLIARVEAMKTSGDCTKMVDYVPYAKWLGLGFTLEEGTLLGKLAYSDMLIGNPSLPALHGGTLGALLESMSIFEILFRQESFVVPKTINITVDYLRSGRPIDTFASATITKLGRRVVAVRSEAWQEDRARLIATANAHFLVTTETG